MYNLFFNKKSKRKFEIYLFLLFSKSGRTEEEILKNFQITKITFTRDLQELEQDLKELFREKVTLFYNPLGKISIKLHSGYTVGCTIDLLRIMYVKQSSLYQTLTAILTKKYLTVESISTDVNLSTSNVYKNLRTIKLMISQFGGKLFLSPTGNLEGNELGIRYFIFLVYWNLFKTSVHMAEFKKVPKEFFDINFLKSQMNIREPLSLSQEVKLKLLQMITAVRLVNNHSYLTPSDEFLSDIQYFYQGKNILNLEEFRVEPEILKKESMILSYLIKGMIYNVSYFSERKAIVEQYRQSTLKIARLTQTILGDFQQEFDINLEKGREDESYYLLISLLIYLKHIQLDVDDFFENPIQQNEKYWETDSDFSFIYTHIQQFLKQYQEKIRLTEIAEKQLIYLLLYIYKVNKTNESIKLFVMNNGGLSNAYLIKDTIRIVFNSDTVEFVDTASDADLIISDVYEEEKISIERFYFNNIYNEKNWKDLIEYIANLISRKAIITWNIR
jgi:predicted transcriptional regulator